MYICVRYLHECIRRTTFFLPSHEAYYFTPFPTVRYIKRQDGQSKRLAVTQRNIHRHSQRLSKITRVSITNINRVNRFYRPPTYSQHRGYSPRETAPLSNGVHSTVVRRRGMEKTKRTRQRRRGEGLAEWPQRHREHCH